MLSNVEDTLSVQLFIKGIHRSLSILAVSESRPTKINLSLQAHDKVIAACHVYHSTGVEIMVKILALHNNANEADLELINKTSKDSCSEQQLKSLVKHFKNKEHIIVLEKKNYIIHNGTSKDVYQKILRLFNSRGIDIFFPTEQRTTIKDPFCPIENMQVPTTIGLSKNHSAKSYKSSQFFNSNNLQFNKDERIYINEDIDQEHNIFKHSVLLEIFTSQNKNAIECTDSYSICRHNTTRIRNNNEQENNNGSAIKDLLEELFLKKGYD
ncbi:8561_t:CDS:2 [Gigaspora margarita]|uniref:8561_t:CDS:1 n=1 Tax=Gigaspora margarita TaxID=4874 RepID=A0ABN7UNG3_GIGMA|nr:8561_t:CDS:2 [Gigaspora margarita]